jgi:hypothetical protein
MEPQPTTPPDGPERFSRQRARPPGPEEDLHAGTAEEAPFDDGPEDWSARYGNPPPPPPRSGPDLSALFILLDGLRRAAPAELQARLTSLIRETLLTLRSLIDWYLEKLDRGRREPEVESIRID